MKKRLIPLISILISVPAISLAQVPQKAWTQKAKEIITNKKVIIGTAIGLAAIISITTGALYYRSRQNQQRLTNNKRSYDLFVNHLSSDLYVLHVDQKYIRQFSNNPNFSLIPPQDPHRQYVDFTDHILTGIVLAKPLPGEDLSKYQAQKLEVVKTIVEDGAYPNGSIKINGKASTILGEVISTHQNPIAEYLIAKGALSLEQPDRDRMMSLLQKTIEAENMVMLTLLLEGGITANNWNKLLHNALDNLDQTKREQIMQALGQIPGVPLNALREYQRFISVMLPL